MVKKWITGLISFLIVLGFIIDFSYSQELPETSPEKVGLSSERLERVVLVIQSAIEHDDIPGAVLLVARKGQVVMRKAFGHAQLIPQKKTMTPDMIFDLASVTKPMATATSTMVLVEQGKLRLLDKVKKFVPDFSRFQCSDGDYAPDARIYHLLTHTSGLPPYFNADSLEKIYGYPCPIDSLVGFVGRLPKLNPPGEKFRYSCLGFITLAKIIKDVSGVNVHQFSQKHIFDPIGMAHTGYIPQVSKRKPDPSAVLIQKGEDKLVPTEVVEGEPYLGTVHDPLARLLGGISGNAGLFSTVDDMLVFAQMLLNKGKFKDVRILSALTVKTMTSIYPVTKASGRGLGWDAASPYSSNGGDIFPGGFGHTGYTGTSIWIDPATETMVILLANRVHPEDDGSVVRLRSLVANVVASAIVE